MNAPRLPAPTWTTALPLGLATTAAHAGDAAAADLALPLLTALLVALLAGCALMLWQLRRRLTLAVAARDDALSRLEHMAQRDPLTGLPNRAMIADRLSQAIYRADRRGRRVAVCAVAPDELRRDNDGDALLAALGQRLSIRLRATDSVGRLDGDGFALLLEEIDDADAAFGIAGDVQRLIGEPLETGGDARTLEACIGIALYPDHGRDTPTLLRKADTALRAAQQEGSGHIRVHRED